MNRPMSVSTMRPHNVCMEQKVVMIKANAGMLIPNCAYFSKLGDARRVIAVISTTVERDRTIQLHKMREEISQNQDIMGTNILMHAK